MSAGPERCPGRGGGGQKVGGGQAGPARCGAAGGQRTSVRASCAAVAGRELAGIWHFKCKVFVLFQNSQPFET